MRGLLFDGDVAIEGTEADAFGTVHFRCYEIPKPGQWPGEIVGHYMTVFHAKINPELGMQMVLEEFNSALVKEELSKVRVRFR